ncbi:hypothetical protein [Candidatus Uabimicrobium sp. HlEnr_7]|uniref:hypothetical protein n=1 Tax=Candidatus Uabimicrobium helgolandensis TaxID=3095367 RepID=UPI003558EE8D
MGGPNGPTINIDPKQFNATLKEVREKLKQVEKVFEEKEYKKREELAAGLIQFDLMYASLTTAENVCREGNVKEIEKACPDYKSAEGSLTTFQKQFETFQAKPSQANYNKLEQTSGHFRDRIAQQVLEWGGRPIFKQHFEQLTNQIKALSEETNRLITIRESIDRFAQREAVNSLHVLYAQDVKKLDKKALYWLRTSIFFFVAFFGVVFYQIYSVQTFFEAIKPLNGLGLWGPIILIGPRVILLVIILTVAILTWRNYHSYMHLSFSSRRREEVARILPLLLKDEKDASKTALRAEFLKLMATPEETGFIAQAKQKLQLGPFNNG